jgi:formylglycine-generating enzyme required for sulfatase activity
MKKKIFMMIASILAVLFLLGCNGKTKELYMKDTTTTPPTTKTIIFPNGTAFSGASKEQATQLAQIFVESHNMAMKQRAEMQQSIERTEEATQQLAEAYKKNMETSQMAFQMLKEIAERQGTGEITIFFPVNSSKIKKDSPEYERLVGFTDYLARESNDRKVFIISIGSASAFGNAKLNEQLAKKRSQAPISIIDHYLVKIPHEFYKVYGTGDMYSPKDVSMKIHDRYQHVHLTAFYEDIEEEKAPPSGVLPTSEQAKPHKTTLIVTQRKPAPPDKDRLTNSIGMEFIYISPGTFIMGSPPDEYGRDGFERQHQVTLTEGFYMQKTEVTQKQWKTIMEDNPSHFLNCGEGCPVERVSWYDAQEFIKKLNHKEKTKKYRLPTESEWEYACRAGSNTAFTNGSITKETCGYNPYLNEAGWYYRNSEQGTHTVAQKQANAWGLYDMHGNVWEWCQDWQRKYPFHPETDPTGPPTGLARIRRGGSWSHYPLFCRSAYRSWSDPDKKTPHVGFRLVRSLVEPELEIVETPIPQPIEESITIRDVNFDLDSFEIKEDMIPVLEKVAEILKGRTDNIILEGHTCSLASEDYNQKLSENRAASVKAFLINKGIPGSRIETVGYGKKMPKYNNMTDEGRRLNRRVQIHLKQGEP